MATNFYAGQTDYIDQLNALATANQLVDIETGLDSLATSVAAAAGSASAAAASQTAAANSATTATNQATTATNKANTATTQASNAAASAAAALASQTAAANSATAAAASQTAAANSATTATNQATTATNQANTATTQASNAAASAAAALASQTAAANSATTATNQATTATNQATTATNQANTATTQAGIATTQASNAAASAAAALASQTAAANSATTATNQANTATSQASTATTQAGIAITQASNAASSAAAALASQTAAANSATTASTQATNAANSAAAAAGYLAPTNGTSTTSITLATGTINFTTQTGKNLVPGHPIKVVRTSDPIATYFLGTVVSYNSGTGDVVMSSSEFTGTGTFTDWTWTVASVASGNIVNLTVTGTALIGDSESLDVHTIKGGTTLAANTTTPALTVTQSGTGYAISAPGNFVMGKTDLTGLNYIDGRLNINASNSARSLYVNTQNLAAYAAISLNSTSTSYAGGIINNYGSTALTTCTGFTNIADAETGVTTYIGFNNRSYVADANAVTTYSHFYADHGSVGTGSIGTVYGFRVSSTIAVGTNNYGYYGNLSSGTGKWNLYMAGTAANYLAGALTVNGALGVNGATTLNAASAILVNSSSPALTITQSGAGNALTITGNVSATSINSTPIGATTPSTGAFTTLSAAGSIDFNKPADIWTSGVVMPLANGNAGIFYTHGSYKSSWASNGYRNNTTTWTSLGVNGATGATMIEQDPTGIITFHTDASKATGSATAVTERMRIDSTGVTTFKPGGSLMATINTTGLTVAGTVTTKQLTKYSDSYTEHHELRLVPSAAIGDLDTYLDTNEGFELISVTPAGPSQNYLFTGTIYDTTPNNYEAVKFYWSIRSNTLPSITFKLRTNISSTFGTGTRRFNLVTWYNATTGVVKLIAKAAAGVSNAQSFNASIDVLLRGAYTDFTIASTHISVSTPTAGFAETADTQEALIDATNYNITLPALIKPDGTNTIANFSSTGVTTYGTTSNGSAAEKLVLTTTNSVFDWASSEFASGMTAGNNLVHFIGQAGSLKNAAYFGFKYNGSSADTNILTLGLHGVDNILNINGLGNVGIGTQTPGFKLEVSGEASLPRLNMNRSASAGTGQLYYSNAYTAWQTYMAPSGTAGQGYGSNITTPTGAYVTGWALRSFIENPSGYGWTWESGTSASTTPSIVAELTASNGVFRTIGSFRAPVFYDYDNTGYYIDAASTSNINTLIANGRITANATASYSAITSTGAGTAAVEFPTITVANDGNNKFVPFLRGATVLNGAGYIQHVSFGDYRNGVNNWSGGAYIGVGGNDSYPTEWWALNYGGSLGHSNGYVVVNGSTRSPIFYDSDNTGYYINAAGDSNINNQTVQGNSYSYGWWRNYNLNGLYNDTHANHWYASSSSQWNIGATSSSVAQIAFRTGGHEGTIRGYVYADSSNNIGFVGSGGAWKARVVANDYFLVDGSSARAPLYYDSNDTGYYIDANSTSVMYRVNINNNIVFTNYGRGMVGTYDSYRYQAVFAMGDSYKLPDDGTTTGSLYGIAWSHPNAGGVAANLDSHGLLVLINGGFGSAMSYSIKASGNVTAYSDERLKTNWRNLPDNYVERLAEVRVGIYDRIDGEKPTQVGVSAQSLQKLLPDAVIVANDDMKTLSVAYGNAALASAVELAKEVVSLKRVIQEQNDRLQRLEALVASLA